MDYKEKYEQALKIAQETYNTQPMYKEWLEKMFPELAESEDERVRKALVRFHKSTIDIDGIKGADIISWLEKQGKPSDEEMKTILRSEYEKGRADAIAEMQGEWSEEDEENFCSVYLDVKSARQNTVNSLSGELKEQEQKRMDEVISWLKSLRPQNRWKPSDEQMGVIEAVINNRSFQRRHLDSLYEQLKNLKEGKV